MNRIGLYAKAITATVVALLTATNGALSDGAITPVEWSVIAGAGLLALGAVWAVPNTPALVASYGKAGTAGLVAGAAAFGTGIADGTMTPSDWILVILAVIGGTGLIAVVPNAASSDPTDAAGKPVPIPAEVKAELAEPGKTTVTTTSDGTMTVPETVTAVKANPNRRAPR